MNNAETWMEVCDESIGKLEELQNLFLRVILNVPLSTPKLALCWDTGTTPMSHRIIQKKLDFVNIIKHQDKDVLSRQIFDEQVRLKLPGLAKECEDICQKWGLKNIIENEVPVKEWKRTIKKASREQIEKEMKAKMNTSKLKEMSEGSFGMKDYIKDKVIENARLMFRIRSHMVDVKANFKGDPRYSRELWLCDGCQKTVETQTHVIFCPAYTKLREGRDLQSDKDLVNYFREVLSIRQNLTGL